MKKIKNIKDLLLSRGHIFIPFLPTKNEFDECVLLKKEKMK